MRVFAVICSVISLVYIVFHPEVHYLCEELYKKFFKK